ncbi:MAG TPA: efflux transporter outer membrane subunit [Nevskia sp.]|nr:efflux transporter outer membrane subunit [Nevskia sp.]
MKALPLVLSALSLTLAACVTAPAEIPKAQPLEGAQLGLGALPASIADSAWWQAYGDPQLDRLMQQALADNPSLAEALARVREAQQLDLVAKSRLYPGVDFNASETRGKFSGQDLVPPPYAGHVGWEGSQGLNLSWDLDFWGRQADLLKQSRAQTSAASLDAAGARLAITGALLRSYIELDRQYALADIAERTARQREEILNITHKRVAAGLDTNVELRQASGAVPDTEVQLRQARYDQDLAVHRLAALSGHGAEVYAGIRRPALDERAELKLPEALPADLLGRRPDVLAARARIDAATAGQAAAKAAFYPDVNLAAFAGTAAIGFGNLFQAASGTYGAGPAIHLPLFNAGRLKAEYGAAGAEIDAGVASYDATVLNAVREVSDQLSAIDALREQIAKQQQALEDAEVAYALASERYEAGLASYLTVLNAETQLLNERRQRVDLVASLAIARISLQLAVGGSFDPATPATAVAAN